MAGMRIGYAFGSEKLIAYLNDVKYSFNSYTMDQLTLALGKASVEDREYFKQTTDKIIRTREWTKEELKKLGFLFEDSKSNFVFVTHPNVSAKQLFENLKKRMSMCVILQNRSVSVIIFGLRSEPMKKCKS